MLLTNYDRYIFEKYCVEFILWCFSYQIQTQLLHTEIVMVVHVLQKSNHTFFSWMDVVFVANVAQQKYPRVPYMDSIDFLTTKRIDGTWVMFVILDVLNVIHYSLSLCTYTIISFSISCYNIFVVFDVIQICYKHANI